ncbi:neprilysin-4 [Drosophila busckii]|uniref:neprilysin-4 n=1 Tax=Drosophila busckii TaxID=30019 RepID=UPI001433300C|nr:neprilysin-4 [Drosophila busckii]
MRDLAAFVYLAVIVVVTLPAINAGGYEALSFNTPLAHQIMREAKSAGMRAYLNSSVRPCDDFYAYACGNYARINPATEQSTSTDLFTTLNGGYQRHVRQLLRQPKLTSDSGTEMRVKYFYDSCLNRTMWQQRAQLLQLFKELGGLPALEGSAWDEFSFDAVELMAQLLRRFGKITLLNVKVAPGIAYSQTNRLYFGQHTDPLGEQASPWAQLLSDDLLLQRNLQQLLGLSAEIAHSTAVELIKLQLKLLRSKGEPSEHVPRLVMLSELDTPGLNLTRFVRSWLGLNYQLPVYEYVPSYLRQLQQLLASTPKRVLANYMLSTLLNDFMLEQVATEEQQQQLCARKTSELFETYVQHMVYAELALQNPQIPGMLRGLWQEQKLAFEQLLRHSWLDASTLEQALAKLKAMSFYIMGTEAQELEQHYDELVISSADYFGNVQRILELRGQQLRLRLQLVPNPKLYEGMPMSPFYVPAYNRVFIPASFLQHRYFWDEAYPMALKYATVGYSLAQELAHGFDDYSRRFDEQGSLRNWWQQNATAEFEQRRQCLLAQFSEGPTMPDENIAANVGVAIAFQAYSNWLQQQTSELELESLPRMSHSPQQLFFLGLAQLWCSDLLPQLRKLLDSNVAYTPHEQRLQSMLANSLAFAETYACEQNSRMNPTHKCLIF